MQTRFAFDLRAGLVASALALGVMAAVAPAAQAQGPMRATVPFSFDGGGKHYAPGKYEVTRASSSILEITNETTGQRGVVMTHSAEQLNQCEQSKLVFRRVGNRYFLKQIWAQGSNTGSELPTSRAEKEALVAQTEAPQGNVIVALNRLPH